MTKSTTDGVGVDFTIYVNGTATVLTGSHPTFDYADSKISVAGVSTHSVKQGDRYYDEFQAWDSALSASQISDLYAAFTTPSTSGTATVTVKAVAVERNVDSWFADQTFEVTVSAGAPSLLTALPDVSGTTVIDLTQHFDDPQGAGTLTYAVTVEDPNVVNATIEGTTLHVQNGLFREGRSLVTVTATDGYGTVSDALNASYSFVAFTFNTEYAYEFTIAVPPMDGTTYQQMFVNEFLAYDADGNPTQLTNAEVLCHVQPYYDDSNPTDYGDSYDWDNTMDRILDGSVTTRYEWYGAAGKSEGTAETKMFTVTVQKKLSSVELVTEPLGSNGNVYDVDHHR